MTTERILPARFDPFQQTEHDDPARLYAEMRAAGAVCRGGPAQWLIPRYQEVSRLLRDARLGQFQFADAYRLFPATLRQSLGDGPANSFTQRVVAGLDRPAHGPVRRLLAESFTSARVQAMSDRISSRAGELLDAAADTGGFDAVEDLAFPLPLTILGELLGIAPDERELVGHQVLELAKIFTAVLSDEDRASADAAVTWLRDYVEQLVAAGAGTDTVLDRMAHAQAAGTVDRAQLLDNAIFLLFAGLETSMTMISSLCAGLPRHQDQLNILRADPALVPSAVEEVLRFDPPTRITGRIVLEPVPVGDRVLRAGRVVFLLIASANRDERQFRAPETFDVTRRPNPHLSFGSGMHYCVGAGLARLEGAIVLRQLLERFAVFEPDGEPVLAGSATLRSYQHVPVRVGRSR
ncbi:cytochrome P450 [Nocardia iowensis]|uniref:Cytochrome P450 n=1 Tax=Nocardia iowensis TaxID=204891 RepID=A0ABX8RFQ8_NOCIO|nr:cytochrome P450 [Nocardia iowensis]QXN88448.1 cytochrome P450 [Nocardia iowensis]